MKKISFFAKLKAWTLAHKFIAAVIVLILGGGGYEIYRTAAAGSAVPQYALSPAHIGMIRQTVTGTGQVSASNQTDIQAQVSGTVKSITVSVGQNVHAGELIATLDSTNAAISLENARLSLQKIQAPAKASDLSNAESGVTKSYADAFNSASAAFTDLSTVTASLKDMYYGPSGVLTDRYAAFLNTDRQALRNSTGKEYDALIIDYGRILQEYQSLTPHSATSSIAHLLDGTYGVLKSLVTVLKDTQHTLDVIAAEEPTYHPSDVTSASSNVSSWLSKTSGDLTSVAGSQSSIVSSTNSLGDLVAGADEYDLRSAQLSFLQAQRTYENYFIRAPYDGVIGRIPVALYGQAGSGSAVATIIGAQKIASISLNEVDAAKVSVGQPVDITLDAIDSFNATGTVSEVDQVGTVSQGVVSYGVKIAISTADPRIKPGMSVNTSIITKEEDGVLVVPSSAVKTLGTRTYVQIMDQSALASLRSNMRTGQNASTTRSFGGRNFASSTQQTGTPAGENANLASSTRTFGGTGRSGPAVSLTVSSATAPQNVDVITGDSDDANTVILSGLSAGQLVVTRTTATGSGQASAAPSIFQSIGGNRGAGGGGTFRTGGAVPVRTGTGG